MKFYTPRDSIDRRVLRLVRVAGSPAQQLRRLKATDVRACDYDGAVFRRKRFEVRVTTAVT